MKTYNISITIFNDSWTVYKKTVDISSTKNIEEIMSDITLQSELLDEKKNE